MKHITTLCIIFFTVLFYGQEGLGFTKTDWAYKAGVSHSTNISNSLELEKSIGVRTIADVAILEMQFVLKHKLKNNWSLFFGGQAATIIQPSQTHFGVNAINQNDFSFVLGVEKIFNSGVIGNLTIQQSIIKPINTTSSGLNYRPINANLGIKF